MATHGRISFVELSKTVAASWRSVDIETKRFCSELYAVGMQKYKRDMKLYKMYVHSKNKSEEEMKQHSNHVYEMSKKMRNEEEARRTKK